jgi:hypothetical protein
MQAQGARRRWSRGSLLLLALGLALGLCPAATTAQEPISTVFIYCLQLVTPTPTDVLARVQVQTSHHHDDGLVIRAGRQTECGSQYVFDPPRPWQALLSLESLSADWQVAGIVGGSIRSNHEPPTPRPLLVAGGPARPSPHHTRPTMPRRLLGCQAQPTAGRIHRLKQKPRSPIPSSGRVRPVLRKPGTEGLEAIVPV